MILFVCTISVCSGCWTEESRFLEINTDDSPEQHGLPGTKVWGKFSWIDPDDGEEMVIEYKADNFRLRLGDS